MDWVPQALYQRVNDCRFFFREVWYGDWYEREARGEGEKRNPSSLYASRASVSNRSMF
jgi:hypothetical protein